MKFQLTEMIWKQKFIPSAPSVVTTTLLRLISLTAQTGATSYVCISQNQLLREQFTYIYKHLLIYSPPPPEL